MSQTFRTTRQIQWRETDAAGIAHFTCFIEYMEEAEHEFLRHRGLSVSMNDAEGHISWPRVSVQCNFHSPVRFEDVLDVDVSVKKLGSKSITYGFQFTCEGRKIAEGELSSVCCRIEDTGPRSITIPDAMREKLAGAAGDVT